MDKFMHSIGLATHKSSPEDGSPMIQELNALPVMDTRTYLNISAHLLNCLDHHRPCITQCTCNGLVYFLFPFPPPETIDAINPSEASGEIADYITSLVKMMRDVPFQDRIHTKLFVKIQQPPS